MPRFNFSLRTLLLIVAFIAAACATLRYPSGWLASVWSLVTILTLLFAVLAGLVGRGPARPFWIGFAVFGWGYFWLSLFPSTLFPDVARQLVTTKALFSAYWAVHSDGGYTTGLLMESPGNVNSVWSSTGTANLTLLNSGLVVSNVTGFAPSASSGQRLLSLEDYVRVGHGLCALAIAWLGGQLGTMLGRREAAVPAGSAV